MRPSFSRFELFASSIISLSEQKDNCKQSHGEQLLRIRDKPSEFPDPSPSMLIKLFHGVIRVGSFVVDHIKIARYTASKKINKNFKSVKCTAWSLMYPTERDPSIFLFLPSLS